MAKKSSKSGPAGAKAGRGIDGGNAIVASKPITKSEAVRRAIADGAGQPAAGVAYIKSHFGLDISPTHFSAVKTTEKKKSGTITIKAKGRPKGSKNVSKPTSALPGSPAATLTTGEADLLQALEAIKPLVASLGADRVKRLADLLA